jgi:hypothetical protein
VHNCPNDSWNYVQQAIDHMKAGKGPRAYVNIMGGAKYFEGLLCLKDGTFRLDFGS